ncbi:SDR family oxidoreductase [Galbibacter pacificus]|uniref:SDR family oxidoreductase n=1 Tax=Galbibacter pacificus TaxID=2996052 RepID=A0ABT6FMR1_9FLAO|nr:SDR family oxidoreductase [Galbibacter pacificus]MDG3581075.1 SDR family oxidoreductase [Galbibacter pacificus]MDG3584553.1 SDR family oxidoreductase [Galbibacter pacificus]
MILVTGATGHLGSAVISHLQKNISVDSFIALARSEEKAQSLKAKGIQVRIADFDDIASIEKAFEGIEKLLLISTIDHNRAEQQKAVVDEAKKAGIKHIAYTGVSLKDVNKSATKKLMESHFQTEGHIKKSGLSYTFLRNSLYTDVIPMHVGEHVFETGIFLPAGNGKLPYALRREMGEAAANVLLQDGHENKTYEIAGSELYSYTDVAKALSEISGKEVNYTNANLKEFTQKLKQNGVNEFMVSIIAGFSTDIKNHQYEIVTKDLEKLIGRKPKALAEALREVYNL